MAIKEKGSLSTTVTVSRLPDMSGNWVCDGTADDVEINEALNYVNTLGGGRVMLKQGTYTLANPIVFPGNDIWLRGMGRSTLIDGNALTTGNHAIELTGRTNCAIKKLAIQTLDGGGKTCHCIFAEDGCDNLNIYDITIVDSDSDGIHIEGTTTFDVHIRGIRVNDVDDYGIYVGMDGVNYCDRLLINGALVLGAGLIGIRLGDCRYSGVSNSLSALNTQSGIVLDSCSYCDLSNCISVYNTQHGIILAGTIHCNTEGCNASLNGYHGIYLNASDESQIEGCTCHGNDSGDTGTYDGINVDGDSDMCNVIANHCCHNDRYGVLVGGAQNNISDNYCYDNSQDGIHATGTFAKITGNYLQENGYHGIYAGALQALIEGNYCDNNGTATAGTYHGISLGADADRSSVVGNFIWADASVTAYTEDGIHLADGAIECQICNNYIYDLLGSGIALAANNDNCLISNNFIQLCDDYGIEITADTCDKNIVRGNQLKDNVTAAILDSGTLTQVGDDNEGIEITDIKIYRTLKNTSGGALGAGDVVVLKAVAAGNEIDTTITEGDDKVYGMVAEAIANDATGYVQVKGKTTALKVNGTVDIAIGDPLGAYTEAGIAMKAAGGAMAFAIALAAYATDDSSGVIDAYIKSPWD